MSSKLREIQYNNESMSDEEIEVEELDLSSSEDEMNEYIISNENPSSAPTSFNKYTFHNNRLTPATNNSSNNGNNIYLPNIENVNNYFSNSNKRLNAKSASKSSLKASNLKVTYQGEQANLNINEPIGTNTYISPRLLPQENAYSQTNYQPIVPPMNVAVNSINTASFTYKNNLISNANTNYQKPSAVSYTKGIPISENTLIKTHRMHRKRTMRLTKQAQSEVAFFYKFDLDLLLKISVEQWVDFITITTYFLWQYPDIVPSPSFMEDAYDTLVDSTPQEIKHFLAYRRFLYPFMVKTSPNPFVIIFAIVYLFNLRECIPDEVVIPRSETFVFPVLVMLSDKFIQDVHQLPAKYWALAAKMKAEDLIFLQRKIMKYLGYSLMVTYEEVENVVTLVDQFVQQDFEFDELVHQISPASSNSYTAPNMFHEEALEEVNANDVKEAESYLVQFRSLLEEQYEYIPTVVISATFSNLNPPNPKYTVMPKRMVYREIDDGAMYGDNELEGYPYPYDLQGSPQAIPSYPFKQPVSNHRLSTSLPKNTYDPIKNWASGMDDHSNEDNSFSSESGNNQFSVDNEIFEPFKSLRRPNSVAREHPFPSFNRATRRRQSMNQMSEKYDNDFEEPSENQSSFINQEVQEVQEMVEGDEEWIQYPDETSRKPSMLNRAMSLLSKKKKGSVSSGKSSQKQSTLPSNHKNNNDEEYAPESGVARTPGSIPIQVRTPASAPGLVQSLPPPPLPYEFLNTKPTTKKGRSRNKRHSMGTAIVYHSPVPNSPSNLKQNIDSKKKNRRLSSSSVPSSTLNRNKRHSLPMYISDDEFDVSHGYNYIYEDEDDDEVFNPPPRTSTKKFPSQHPLMMKKKEKVREEELSEDFIYNDYIEDENPSGTPKTPKTPTKLKTKFSKLFNKNKHRRNQSNKEKVTPSDLGMNFNHPRSTIMIPDEKYMDDLDEFDDTEDEEISNEHVVPIAYPTAYPSAYPTFVPALPTTPPPPPKVSGTPTKSKTPKLKSPKLKSPKLKSPKLKTPKLKTPKLASAKASKSAPITPPVAPINVPVITTTAPAKPANTNLFSFKTKIKKIRSKDKVKGNEAERLKHIEMEKKRFKEIDLERMKEMERIREKIKEMEAEKDKEKEKFKMKMKEMEAEKDKEMEKLKMKIKEMEKEKEKMKKEKDTERSKGKRTEVYDMNTEKEYDQSSNYLKNTSFGEGDKNQKPKLITKTSYLLPKRKNGSTTPTITSAPIPSGNTSIPIPPITPPTVSTTINGINSSNSLANALRSDSIPNVNVSGNVRRMASVPSLDSPSPALSASSSYSHRSNSKRRPKNNKAYAILGTSPSLSKSSSNLKLNTPNPSQTINLSPMKKEKENKPLKTMYYTEELQTSPYMVEKNEPNMVESNHNKEDHHQGSAAKRSGGNPANPNKWLGKFMKSIVIKK